MVTMAEKDVTINPRTGLREARNEFYGVPEVQQRGIGRLTFGGQPTAVHTVPLPGGLTLDFFAKLHASDELVVTFVGAANPDKNRYPLFQRVATFRNAVPAVIAFADPTIKMDHNREMLLSWYLGGPGFDPLPLILRAIRRAQGKTAAKHVAFVGGSGGGFAALRASAMLPGSMAYVQDPQTAIAPYIPSVVDTYFSTVWPGWDKGQLIDAFPERFDMVQHYRYAAPKNFVYYVQNESDPSHVEKHYRPFKEAHGVKTESGIARGGARVFEQFRGEVQGHGRITTPEFLHYFDLAREMWRAWRPH